MNKHESGKQVAANGILRAMQPLRLSGALPTFHHLRLLYKQEEYPEFFFNHLLSLLKFLSSSL